MSIKLSKEHGLNPAMTVCFWCGKETGVAVLGELPKDEKAPKHVFGGYDPCPECEEKFNRGILVFEADHTPINPNQPPIGVDDKNKPLYPTGNFCVMDKEAFRLDKIPTNKALALSPRAFGEMLNEAREHLNIEMDEEGVETYDRDRDANRNKGMH